MYTHNQENRSQLHPIPVSLLPYVTKFCKKSNKYLIRPKTSRAGADDNYFEVDQLAMKNFPTVTIKILDAKNTKNIDFYI